MLVTLHVFFGTAALVLVPAALLARKGSLWHKRLGAAFTIAMTVVLLSAGFLWQAKGHIFLVPLAAVSGFLIFNGWRVIARRRRRNRDAIEDAVDRLADVAVMAAGVATAYIGFAFPIAHALQIRPALIGIGFVAVCFGVEDMIRIGARRTRTGWLLAHLAAMLASYISAVTAFLVINAHHAPMFLRWFIPSVAGAATIAAFSTKILLPTWVPALRALSARVSSYREKRSGAPTARM